MISGFLQTHFLLLWEVRKSSNHLIHDFTILPKSFIIKIWKVRLSFLRQSTHDSLLISGNHSFSLPMMFVTMTSLLLSKAITTSGLLSLTRKTKFHCLNPFMSAQVDRSRLKSTITPMRCCTFALWFGKVPPYTHRSDIVREAFGKRANREENSDIEQATEWCCFVV